MIITKSVGTTIWSTITAPSMPPSTTVPIERRLCAPAPVAMTSGRMPRMNAKLVIRIGRSRSFDAFTAASSTDSPA